MSALKKDRLSSNALSAMDKTLPGMTIHDDEDNQDFLMEIEALNSASEKEVHTSWKVFTKLKDTLESGRRMENACWRLWNKQRLEGTLPAGAGIGEVDSRAIDRLLDFSTTVSKGLEEKAPKNRTDLCGALSSVAAGELDAQLIAQIKSYIDRRSDADVQAFLDLVHAPEFDLSMIPKDVSDLRAVIKANSARARPLCAVFSHSLQRNGANNFILYVVRKMLGEQRFVLFSPSEGPMRSDFEGIGVRVQLLDPKHAEYSAQVAAKMKELQVGVILANTIMNAPIVNEAAAMKIPSVWVIHEAWPPEQFAYYAGEVFMMPHLKVEGINSAFAVADRIVFPSEIQRNIYSSILREGTAVVVYNGIPLTSINAYKMSHDRDEVRAGLGYGKEDFVVLHIGTVCGRKGQVHTAAATAMLKKKGVAKLKTLIVGARYIRDHEIAYIQQIKDTLDAGGVDYCRWEDTPEEQRGQATVTIMDIQSSVLHFYLAADVIIVPSLNEVLPLVICEAMAMEKPVVASQIDGIPEAITHDDNGLLIQPGSPESLCDAIYRVYAEPGLAERLGKNGKQRVENQFSYKVMSQQYRTIMDDIVEVKADERAGLSTQVPDMTSYTVLIDMDNTLVDWDAQFRTRLERLAPGVQLPEKRTEFEIEKNLAESAYPKVMEVIASEGFFAELKMFPGAKDALEAMLINGADVRLVTSPHPACFARCAADKYTWVEQNLGAHWVKRLIICSDKTAVAGDFLIDDKPAVTGANKTPTWTQLHFAMPYNEAVRQVATTIQSWKPEDWVPVMRKLVLR